VPGGLATGTLCPLVPHLAADMLAATRNAHQHGGDGGAVVSAQISRHRRGRLEGRIVLVTGATSGIGRAIALAAAAEGADIAITYRDRQDHARAVAENISALGRRCELFRFDLRDEASIGALVSGISSAFDHLDAWINNAGADILTGAGVAKSPVEKLDELLLADLRGTILTSWAASRLLKQQPGGGVIVNMSWDHALSGMPGTNPEIFSAVKGGILSFSKSLARSVAPTVRVNVLAPGWIATAFADELKRDQAERYREVAASTPLRRWGTPEDVAQAAVFLASPDAAFLTGQVLLVNGGVVM